MIGAFLLQHVDRRAHALLDRRIEPRVEEFASRPTRRPLSGWLQLGRRSPAPARSTLVESRGSKPGHGLEQQRGILGRARQHARLVEARGERDHAVARHAAVGRLDAREVGQRRRLADRAAGVGAGGRGREAGRHGGGRAARRAAGHALEVPGVLAPGRRSSSRWTSPSRTRPCWSCRAAPCPPPPALDDGGVVGRDEVRQHLRPAGGAGCRRCRRCPCARSARRSAGRPRPWPASRRPPGRRPGRDRP